MSLLSVIASRNRVDRYRHLFTVNVDKLQSDVTVGASDIYIEFDSIINGSSGVYIINRAGVQGHGFLFRIFEDLTCSFGIFGGDFVSLIPLPPSSSWRNFRLEINIGGGNKIELFIDDVLHDSVAIGAITPTSTPPVKITSLQFDVLIDNLIINSIRYDMNESKGFVSSSDTGSNELIGETANAGGLTYWENNVIKER